jgi:hypothetical protein
LEPFPQPMDFIGLNFPDHKTKSTHDHPCRPCYPQELSKGHVCVCVCVWGIAISNLLDKPYDLDELSEP